MKVNLSDRIERRAFSPPGPCGGYSTNLSDRIERKAVWRDAYFHPEAESFR